jgi:hypothetical protein
MVGTFRLDAESRRGSLLVSLSRPGRHYDDHRVSVGPVQCISQGFLHRSTWTIEWPLLATLKFRCQVHRWRIHEPKNYGGIGMIIWGNLRVTGVSKCSVHWNNVVWGDSSGFWVGSLGRRAQVHPFVYAEVNVLYVYSDRCQSRLCIAYSWPCACPSVKLLSFFLLWLFHELMARSHE